MSIPENSIAASEKKEVKNWWWRYHMKPPKKVIVSSKAPAWWNWIETRILRSSLHYWRSETDMLLTFTGRKSGKTYTVPLCYLRDGDTIKCITKVSWWKNLSGEVPVTVRVKGRDLQGIADTIVDDKEAVAEVMTRLIKAAPVGAKYYGVQYGPDGKPDPESVKNAAQFTVLICIRLTH